ncbi:hypothetical protein [Providencia rettgeri]|uniref:hypothetical protein n=1 Tax=Providencia rettgeri TaxID=587 RepID=UPI00235EBADF|nr:hypothetical protein [Providencia rettgeri]
MKQLTDKNCGEVIRVLTRSWSYLAIGSALSLIFQLSLFLGINNGKYYLFISIILFIISHYYIYRLWLDNHFFKVIYQQGTIEPFDYALNFLIPNKPTNRTMEQRWQGTKTLFNRALLSVVILWIWLLVTVIAL